MMWYLSLTWILLHDSRVNFEEVLLVQKPSQGENTHFGCLFGVHSLKESTGLEFGDELRVLEVSECKENREKPKKIWRLTGNYATKTARGHRQKRHAQTNPLSNQPIFGKFYLQKLAKKSPKNNKVLNNFAFFVESIYSLVSLELFKD